MGAMTNAMGSIGGAINKVGKGAIGGVKQVGGQIGVPGMKAPGVPGQPGLAGGGAVTGAIGGAQGAMGQTTGGVPQGPGGGKQVFREQAETPKLGGGEMPQATGPAGGGGVLQPGGAPAGQPLPDWQGRGTIGPGMQPTVGGGGIMAGQGAPYLPGGLPGLGGMKRNLMQNPQLTAQGALGKQPAQTTMQKMMGLGGKGGGFWKKYGQPNMGGGGGGIWENFPTRSGGGGGDPGMTLNPEYQTAQGQERLNKMFPKAGTGVFRERLMNQQPQQPGAPQQPQGIVAPDPNFPVDPRMRF